MNPPPRSPPFLWKNINKRASERHAQSVTRVLDVAIFTTLAPAGRRARETGAAPRGAPCEKIGPGKPVLSALDFFAKSRLSASLPGSLAASDALGLARSGFEATPVIDADHGVSES